MEVPKLNYIFRLLDFLLWPLMFLVGGFKFPVQETHPWHVKRYPWNRKGLKIVGDDRKAKFSQSGISKYLGLYHMPVFGGLRKYVVIKADNFSNYWYVGWDNHIQILKIYDSSIKLLVGKEGFSAYGWGDNGKNLQLKIVGFGELGDGRYKNIRLF